MLREQNPVEVLLYTTKELDEVIEAVTDFIRNKVAYLPVVDYMTVLAAIQVTCLNMQVSGIRYELYERGVNVYGEVE